MVAITPSMPCFLSVAAITLIWSASRSGAIFSSSSSDIIVRASGTIGASVAPTSRSPAANTAVTVDLADDTETGTKGVVLNITGVSGGTGTSGAFKVGDVPSREAAKKMAQIGHWTLNKLSELGVSSFVFINGLALGAGFMLALHADQVAGAVGRLVELHGSAISVSSTLGKGTQFNFVVEFE